MSIQTLTDKKEGGKYTKTQSEFILKLIIKGYKQSISQTKVNFVKSYLLAPSAAVECK